MTSVRFGAKLEERVQKAAASIGKRKSEFIRQTMEEKCDSLLEPSLLERMGDIVGCVHGDGKPYSISDAFSEALEAKYDRIKKQKSDGDAN